MDGLAIESGDGFNPYATMDDIGRLAPRPKTIEDTGLSEIFLADLVTKHLYDAGVLNIQQLSNRTALAGSILDIVLAFLRREARIEVLGSTGENCGLRYALTDRGRAAALDALMKSGYIGAAPVPLDDYVNVVNAQSVHNLIISRDDIRDAYTDVMVRDDTLDLLGPALHSGRAIFIYGPAGTGKTYITQRLINLFDDTILVPHAIAINETVIQFFDPLLHSVVDDANWIPNVIFEQSFDSRFARCKRPVVITGGELTLDMLEVQYDPATKEYQAPLQMKANNGIFIVDDLGRQRVPPVELLNRWIVPMEEGRDYLNLGAGRHFSIPFDVILVFSTNMNPLELADEAFLRRIGYKIHFDYLDPREYEVIWRQVCEQIGVQFDTELFQYVINDLHGKNNTPLLPCHPRDLIGMAVDQSRYMDKTDELTIDHMRTSWDSYFVNLDKQSQFDISIDPLEGADFND